MPIGKIASMVKQGPAGLLGGQMNRLGGSGDYGGPEQAEARRLAGEQAAFRQKLSAQAQQYRSNLGDTRAKQYAVSNQQRRRELAQDVGDVRRGASSRGLLYSGLRSSGEASAAGGAASKMAQDRERINQETEAKAQNMEREAIGLGLASQSQEQSMNQDLYNRALTSRRDKNASREALFKAGGAAGGMAMAQGGR
jgi:hypothetical protein